MEYPIGVCVFTCHWTEWVHLWECTGFLYSSFIHDVVSVWSELDITGPLSHKFVKRCMMLLENSIWMLSHSIRTPHFLYHLPGFPFCIWSCHQVRTNCALMPLINHNRLAAFFQFLQCFDLEKWTSNCIRTLFIYYLFHCWKYIFKKNLIQRIYIVNKSFSAPEISFQVLKTGQCRWGLFTCIECVLMTVV